MCRPTHGVAFRENSLTILAGQRTSPFVVTYPDSTIRYEIPVRVNAWLEDEEDPRDFECLGTSASSRARVSLHLWGRKRERCRGERGFVQKIELITLNGEPIKSLEEFCGRCSQAVLEQSLRY